MYRIYKSFLNNFAYLSVIIIGAITLTLLLNSLNIQSLVIIFLTIFITSFTILRIKRYRLKKSLERQNLQDLDTSYDEYEISGYNLTVNSQFNIEYFNKQFIDEYKLQQKSILGKNIFDLLDINPGNILSSIGKTKRFKGIVESIDNVGVKKHHSIIFEPISNISSLEYHCIIHDVTSSMQSDKELREKFLVDKFTGLPTKSKLFSDIDDIIAKPILQVNTLIYISIDSFDEINEYFGIDIGNHVLARVGKWLSESLPTNDSILYKLDLDNFAILNTKRFSMSSLDNYLKKISSDIQKEVFSLKGTDHNISFTIGATRSEIDMVKCAYLALKEAKNLTKSYKIFDQGCQHQERFAQNIQTVQMIKNAIVENRVVPFFQPIYNLKTDKIEKYESLIRIKSNDDTYLKPAEFLEIAKKTKLYLELSRSMIKASFDQLEILNFPITINLSVDDILDINLSSFILRRLNSSGHGKFITFEIVESQQIRSIIKIANFIKKVKLMGAQVAIDDFGSGYSNYEQLRDLDVDYLKIDGSLIKDIATDKNSEIFTRSIVSVANEMGIKTIAEFVSTQAILDKVKMLGIDYAQGYYIGKPALHMLPSSIND